MADDRGDPRSWSLRQARRGCPLHPRKGKLLRRHHAPGDAPPRVPSEPACSRTHQVDRHVQGRGGSGRRRRRHRGASRPAQPGLDADAFRRHPGRARHGQGALPGTGGRGRHRGDGLHREGRRRADRRRLRVAAGGLDAPAGPREGRAGHPGREGGPGGQPHLFLRERRQGCDGQGIRRRRPGRRARHVLSALSSGSARVLRLRRRRQPGDREGDDLHDVAGSSCPPHALRARRGAPRAENPHHLAGSRRRLRQQGADLPGLRRRHGRLAPHRPAGEMGRGPYGEPHLDGLRPRLPHARRARAQGRQDHWAARQGSCPTTGRSSPTHSRRSARLACSTSSQAPTTSPRPTSRRRAPTRTRRRVESPTAARSASPRRRT